MDIKEFKKLKVGDKVKIVKEKAGGGWNENGKMDKWLGKTMTIRGTVKTLELEALRMHEDANENVKGWFWFPEMIDCKVDGKVDESATIEMHIIRGNKTVVRLSNGKVGIARCNPQDSFDVYEGLRIATARAYGKEPFADREDTTESTEVRRVKRVAEAGEYVEIVEPDSISREAGLKRGQIRRVYRLGVAKEVRYVRLLPDDDNAFVLVAPNEYVVLENYTGGEV